jgi:broad specificity phosphatase PhoE
VYCSPYVRTRETWRIAARHLPPVPVVDDERLRDREMGRLELLNPAAIRQRFPDEAGRRAKQSDLYYRAPGGESLADVALRLRSFLRDIDVDRRTLVVAHDAVVLMFRYLTEALSEDALYRVGPAYNASISRWTATSGALRLVAYNETEHLDDRAEESA